MDKQEPKNWRLTIMVTIAVLTLPILAILVFLIFDKFDMSAPTTWILIGCFVCLMLWDSFAKRTYHPAWKLFLSRQTRFVRFFGEEIERIGVLWVFLISMLLIDRDEPFLMIENTIFQATSILGLLIFFSALWAGGRVWLASRRDSKRNQ